MRDAESLIKRAHVTLMRHPKTALFSGVFLLGESSVENRSFTAYTDGVNKRYSKSFIESLKDEAEVRAIVLHENLHVALKHIAFGRAMFKENAKLANVAADMVVNNMIDDIKDRISTGPLLTLPRGAVIDPMFKNWSMRQVYDFLKKESEDDDDGDGDGYCDEGEGGGGGDGDIDEGEGGGGDSITINGKEYDLSNADEHDFESEKKLSDEEKEAIDKQIEQALREGALLAGRMGANVPREITEALTPKTDWREELRDFVTSSTKGNDEFTWRRLNRRGLANDVLMPSVENETIGRVVFAIDTSGSIGAEQLNQAASELADICEMCQPEEVMVIWWDTKVHGVQRIREEQYGQLRSVLKPKGGGGTRVSSVSEYINKEGITADCVIVFTDGFVENPVMWQISSPTLWLVTVDYSGFTPPTGKLVKFNR